MLEFMLFVYFDFIGVCLYKVLDLRVRDSCEPLLWVLGTEPRIFGRALGALNH